jgi:membrane protease YdiL (CAAX protease family)
VVATGRLAAGSRCCWSIFPQQAYLHRISRLPGLCRYGLCLPDIQPRASVFAFRSESPSLPVFWRLAVPSTKELLTAVIGTITLIGANVVSATFIRYLNAHGWPVTRFPLPTNSALQYFDGTVGMILVGLSEEVVFRFYLINLLLLRGMSPTTAIIASTLIFGGIHWSYGGGAVVFATFAGLVLSMIFMSTRNLIVPVIAHAAFDAFYFVGGVAFLWRIYNRAW